jgi:chromosome segregation ATPase
MEDVKGRKSDIQPRSFVINRGSGGIKGGRMSGGFRDSMSSANIRPSFSAGTMQAMSSSGLTDFRGNRQKEKRELQNLNERLASYIEKVHFLETQNKKLEAEIEALRNRKTEDLQPIRDAYENELAQARKVIDELSAAKGANDAKMAGLQDEVQNLRDLIATYETHAKDYRKKIDSLGNTIGEYEGELHTLRLRVGSLEDENAKLRELLEKLQDQNRAMRSDLDNETAAHIEAECQAQTNAEEAAFYKDLLDQLKLMQPEPVTIKGQDMTEYWNQSMKKALRDINAAYDEKIEIMQADTEAKLNAQVSSMRSGQVKDNLQLGKAQEECKTLRSQLALKNSANAEMMAKMSALQAERDNMMQQIGELERELEKERLDRTTEVTQLESELAGVMEQLQTLMDAKLSMELEIACYKKLLEGEEQRGLGLRSLVEQAIGTQSKGAASLADVISQSS